MQKGSKPMLLSLFNSRTRSADMARLRHDVAAEFNVETEWADALTDGQVDTLWNAADKAHRARRVELIANAGMAAIGTALMAMNPVGGLLALVAYGVAAVGVKGALEQYKSDLDNALFTHHGRHYAPPDTDAAPETDHDKGAAPPAP